jgi:hypothetical protein
VRSEPLRVQRNGRLQFAEDVPPLCGSFSRQQLQHRVLEWVIQPPSAHNHNHEVQLPTLKIALLISEFDSLYPTPHPVAVCARKGTKRARIEPSQLRVTVFKARKYGFSGLGKSRVIR